MGRQQQTENHGVIYAASFEKPNERVRLVTSDSNALYTPGPDGRGYLLWGRSGTLVAQEFDAVTLKFSGEPRPLADDVGIVGGSGFMAVAVSTSGALLYAAAELQQLTWFDRAGKQLGTLVTRASTPTFAFHTTAGRLRPHA